MKYPSIRLRENTTDKGEFVAIFGPTKGLEIPFDIQPKLIIDAGAYIGLSAYYYAHRYPGATIIVVEPEPSNFALLENNTQTLPQVQRVQAGVWHSDGALRVGNPGAGKNAFFVQETTPSDPQHIPAVSIDTLLQKSGFSHIDILKIDIEGSEQALFSKNYTSWLSKVNVLIIELHDWLYPGCAENFYKAMSDRSEWIEHDVGQAEKVIFSRKKQIV